MNREIERFIQSIDCSKIDALEISGCGSEGRYAFRSYQKTQYPGYDVCEGPLATEQFDLVIAEQVFEHFFDRTVRLSTYTRCSGQAAIS